MTERVQKTLKFLKTELYSCEHNKEKPASAAYRLEHSVRVARIAEQIAQAEGFDAEAVFIAGLLHDIAYGMDFPEGYDMKNHGRDGARIARPFLETLGLPADTVNDICYGIAIHVDDKADFEWRRTPFAETVGDADNIDRFDVYRIHDNLCYKDFTNLPLTERLEWLKGLLPRLEQLKQMQFGTPTATMLWQEKVDYQIGFFQRLLTQMEAGSLAETEETL